VGREFLRVDVGDRAWDRKDVVLIARSFDNLATLGLSKAVPGSNNVKRDMSVSKIRQGRNEWRYRDAQKVEMSLAEDQQTRKGVDSDDPDRVVHLVRAQGKSEERQVGK
jgi:hypothetical protein